MLNRGPYCPIHILLLYVSIGNRGPYRPTHILLLYDSIGNRGPYCPTHILLLYDFTGNRGPYRPTHILLLYDSTGLSDPYCIMAMVHEKEVKKPHKDIHHWEKKKVVHTVWQTKVVPKTLTPVWNQDFETLAAPHCVWTTFRFKFCLLCHFQTHFGHKS